MWWSKAILIGGVIGAALLPLGALGTKFGIWPFSGGFLLLAGGTVLAALAVLGGIIALIVANKKGLVGERPGIYMGMFVGALVLALMGLQFNKARSVPPIHNISTDVSDPPAFDKIVSMREGANPLEYDASKLAELQQAAYPWVQTLQTQATPDAAFQAALTTLSNMGLEIVNQDQAAGRIEATDTTFWFGFKDDVVVRIRASAEGALVDARSVSRVGQSDLGLNAQRIGRLLDGVRGAL